MSIRAVDFQGIARAALGGLDALVIEVDPGARLSGDEWVFMDPQRESKNRGESKINRKTGKWSNFASDAKGGDTISWWAHCHGLSQKDAALFLGNRFGIGTRPSSDAPAKTKSDPNGYALIPVPDHVQEPDWATWGNPQHWQYRDEAGQLLRFHCRQDSDGGKRYFPLTYRALPSGKFGWKAKGLDDPQPLFGLDKLASRPDAPVLLCEGEKASLAAQAHFPDFVCIASANGAKNAGKADWRPLRGRIVSIWPDADQPGAEYAGQAAKLIIGTGGEVRLVEIPKNLPKGWDLADTSPAGMDLRALLDAAVSISTPAAPFAKSIETNQRVEILVQSEAQTTAAALHALAGHGDVFQREGELVRPYIPKGSCGAPCLLSITQPWLRELLSLRAVFKKQTADGSRSILVPDWLPSIILERKNWPEVPSLKAVVETPVFLPSGRTLAEPGLDEAASLYLEPIRPGQMDVPGHPTRADAEKALETLWEAVADFPWAADPSPETHRASWLAFLLTLVGRYAINGPVPFALVNASTRGSGKGLLIKLTSLIACGHIATTGASSGDEEELRKGLFSALLAGERLVWLDEVPSPWGGRAWNGLVTSWPAYSDRVLGKSERRTAPALTVWVVSGNNLGTKADTARRALAIRLEPLDEEPENRDGFRHGDLLAWATNHQPRLLGAALTILRAYHLAGCPSSGLAPVGSFEAWSRLVRDAVHWVTGQDAMATQRVMGIVADEGRQAWRQAIQGLFEAFMDPERPGATKPFTTRDVMGLPEEKRAVLLDSLELLKRSPKELDARAVSRILNAHLGTVARGMRLKQVGRGDKGLCFTVESLAEKSPDEAKPNHSIGGVDPSALLTPDGMTEPRTYAENSRGVA
jgi:putative DNA primase/helicase